MRMKTGSVTLAKSQPGSKTRRQKERSCNKIVLVGDGPFRSPFFPESPLKETLDQIPKKGSGGKQGNRHEGMHRQALPAIYLRTARSAPARSRFRPAIPMMRPRYVFPSPKIRFPSEKFFPRSTGVPPPTERCDRIREICREHYPDRRRATVL